MKNNEKLWLQCLVWGLFNSNQTRRYGTDNFYTSAHRRVQEWAETGRLVRIEKDKAKKLGIQKSKEQWYAVPSKYKELVSEPVEYKTEGKQLVFV